MTKAAELRELNRDELEQLLSEAKEESFNLRFQYATGQFDRTHRFRELRREIARILTVLGEQAESEAEAAVAVQEERVTAETGDHLSLRQRWRARRQARSLRLVEAETKAAGRAGENIELVVPQEEEVPVPSQEEVPAFSQEER